MRVVDASHIGCIWVADYSVDITILHEIQWNSGEHVHAIRAFV